MSQIGKMPIDIPEKVEVKIDKSKVLVLGTKGELNKEFSNLLSIKILNNQVVVGRNSNDRAERSLHGLTRALINNMIIGVNTGFEKTLEIQGVGYTADASKGKFLLLNLGFSHPIYFQQPDDIEFETPKNTIIIIKGIDKQKVGQIAAKIRDLRKAEPYKGKGIRYAGEYVRKKAGKTIAGATPGA